MATLRTVNDAVADLTVSEAARRLAATPQTIRELVRAGKLRAYKLRHALRVRTDSLEALRIGKSV